VIGSWQTKSAHTSFQLPIAITVYGILPSLIPTTSGSGKFDTITLTKPLFA